MLRTRRELDVSLLAVEERCHRWAAAAAPRCLVNGMRCWRKRPLQRHVGCYGAAPLGHHRHQRNPDLRFRLWLLEERLMKHLPRLLALHSSFGESTDRLTLLDVSEKARGSAAHRVRKSLRTQKPQVPVGANWTRVLSWAMASPHLYL